MKIYERWLQALLSSAPRSRVLARLASLAQIGELARRLDKLIHGHQTVSVVFKLTVINKQASEKEHYNILTNQEP